MKDRVLKPFTTWISQTVPFHSNGDGGNDSPISTSILPLPSTYQPLFSASLPRLQHPRRCCLHSRRYSQLKPPHTFYISSGLTHNHINNCRYIIKRPSNRLFLRTQKVLTGFQCLHFHLYNCSNIWEWNTSRDTSNTLLFRT